MFLYIELWFISVAKTIVNRDGWKRDNDGIKQRKLREIILQEAIYEKSIFLSQNWTNEEFTQIYSHFRCINNIFAD